MSATVDRLVPLLPHLLTASRLAAAPAVFVCIGATRIAAAAVLLVLAMLTDLADGPLARRLGVSSRAGAWFDVWADFALVLAVFGGLAAAGMLPAWPLVPIVASFALFVATGRRRAVIYDPFGRHIGGTLMVLGLAALLVQDFAVQEAIAATAFIACTVTIVARLATLLPAGRNRPAAADC